MSTSSEEIMDAASFAAIEGSGVDVLGQLVGAFVDGRIRGRLVLVASAPGTGKSALIDACLAAYGAGKKPRRPLAIHVHGPTLFSGPAAAAPPGGPPVAATSPLKPSEDPAADGGVTVSAPDAPSTPDPRELPTLELLRQLVKDLHVAVVRELAGALREKDPALAEIFRVDQLRGDPDLTRLQAIWQRAGALEAGLIGTGNGWAELTTMWSLERAYMVVSGAYQAKVDAARTRSEELKRTNTVNVAWEKLLTPAISALAGGAVGSQVLPDSPAGQGLLAVLGGLTGTWVSSREGTDKRTRNQSMEFAEALDLPALARWMPGLVRQLKDIGLFPVFVVDELRVEEWKALPGRLLDQLEACRGLVNMGAVFVVLVDRTSYRTFSKQPGPIARKLDQAISDRIFFAFRPGDLRARRLSADELYRSRCRPAEILPHRRASVPPAERAEVQRAWQEAVEQALSGDPWLGRTNERLALTLDLLYAPARAWEEGVRGLTNTREAMEAWAVREGWLADGEPLDDRHVEARNRWLEALVTRKLVHRVGAHARWRRTADGGVQESWFHTGVEARAWVIAIENTLRGRGGIELEAVLGILDDKGGIVDARAWHSDGAVSDDTLLRLANTLADRAEDVQALLLGGLLLAWLSPSGALGDVGVVADEIRYWASQFTVKSRVAATRELARACPFDERLCDAWPPTPMEWPRAAESAVANLQGATNASQHAAAQEALLRASWGDRLEAFRAGTLGRTGGRDVGWSRLRPQLGDLRAVPIHTLEIEAWSHHLLSGARLAPWVEAAGWSLLGFPELIPTVTGPDAALVARATRSVTTGRRAVLVCRAGTAPESAVQRWPAEAGPRVLVLSGERLATVGRLAFDTVLYEPGGDPQADAWLAEKRHEVTATWPTRPKEAVLAAEAHGTGGLVRVRIYPTAAETLAAFP